MCGERGLRFQFYFHIRLPDYYLTEPECSELCTQSARGSAIPPSHSLLPQRAQRCPSSRRMEPRQPGLPRLPAARCHLQRCSGLASPARAARPGARRAGEGARHCRGTAAPEPGPAAPTRSAPRPRCRGELHQQSTRLATLEKPWETIESNHPPALSPGVTSTDLQFLQEWQLHPCPGKLCQRLTILPVKIFFLDIQPEPPLAQPEAVSSCPVTQTKGLLGTEDFPEQK